MRWTEEETKVVSRMLVKMRKKNFSIYKTVLLIQQSGLHYRSFESIRAKMKQVEFEENLKAYDITL